MSILINCSALMYFVTLKTKQQKPLTLTKATLRPKFSVSCKHIRSSVYSTGVKEAHTQCVYTGTHQLSHLRAVTQDSPAAAFVVSLVQTERASAAGQAAPSSAASGCPRWLPSQLWPRWLALKTRRWARGPRRRTGPSCQGCEGAGEPGTLCGHSTCLKSKRKHPPDCSNVTKIEMVYLTGTRQ